ncbi:MAG TPA: indole-3-glycerol phosphate synthase TrpC [Pyrinomonadaceae bacterium]|jgi:indole-3-glycerol phosphate synthase|nr:indole-3-glycerol phosphate synthase TrpC [Pyrinomonadaceae bacterium]
MDFLAEILGLKRERLRPLIEDERAKEELRARAHDARGGASPHRLRGALDERGRVNIIAEIKRASPSKGTIRAGVDPVWMARKYEAGGAAAISVLTEEDRFRGSLADLRAVREVVSLPLLRKDFIFDEFQLYEAAEAGADALLLIVAMLDDESLARLIRITEGELGMDALVEVHSHEELSRALACGATLIGVNNRDLRTFGVSLDISVALALAAPDGLSLVSESGLRSGDDLRRLRSLGYKGFLIGETLMRAPEPDNALRELIQEAERGNDEGRNEGRQR